LKSRVLKRKNFNALAEILKELTQLPTSILAHSKTRISIHDVVMQEQHFSGHLKRTSSALA